MVARSCADPDCASRWRGQRAPPQPDEQASEILAGQAAGSDYDRYGQGAVGQRDAQDNQLGRDKARSKEAPGGCGQVTEMGANGSVRFKIDADDRSPGGSKCMNS
jgi:hypothetical protein